MALVLAPKGLCHHGVREREEGCVGAALLAQGEVALQVLVVQHGLHTFPGDVPAHACQIFRISWLRRQCVGLVSNLGRGGDGPLGLLPIFYMCVGPAHVSCILQAASGFEAGKVLDGRQGWHAGNPCYVNEAVQQGTLMWDAASRVA